jgi:subtilisin family serine protease
MIVELNVLYPGGLESVRDAFYTLWRQATIEFEVEVRHRNRSPTSTLPEVPDGLELIGAKLYHCILTRRQLAGMVDMDEWRAGMRSAPTVIFRVWPDYLLDPQIDRSAPTVKADAAWRSYDARGAGIVWAVIDSGIAGDHHHFSNLELHGEAQGQTLPAGRTSNLHRDFGYLVSLPGERPADQPVKEGGAPLLDENGHGTHVAGIIAGSSVGRDAQGEPVELQVASSKDPGGNGSYIARRHVGTLSGMASECELVSLKVMRRTPQGTWRTSSSAVIAALNYLRTEVNLDPKVLRVHGVNMSLGCEWKPEDYAAGQSPLCQALNQLVASGVVVVVSAGNFGARTATGDTMNTSAVMGSVTEPAHAEDCIAVGSTHRDAPHAFGVTWTSSKGPTLDGRMKPDVVAPGEWITSVAVGEVFRNAGLADNDRPGYAELSGTSMAAPHVSGVIAAFLSARPEFIGRPHQVKRMLIGSATDLGRERYAQGAGLVDLMRMLANI